MTPPKTTNNTPKIRTNFLMMSSDRWSICPPHRHPTALAIRFT
jgi:hypothetical protein